MIKALSYAPNLKDIWNNFNKNAKNGLFMFDRGYMDYHSDRFEDHSLMFYDDEKLIALLPCNLSQNILYSHQGLTFGGFIVDENMKQGKMLESKVFLIFIIKFQHKKIYMLCLETMQIFLG